MESILNEIKGGGLLPDQILGWSTKSILAILLILLSIKVRKVCNES